MSLPKPVKVGIIGCGAISNAYLNGCKTFPILDVVFLADLDVARAEAKAKEFGIPRYGAVEALLNDPEVELVINLTIPLAHTEVNLAALKAGKHVYCEKPFAITREETAVVLGLAKEKGLLVGSAPDTFLGTSHQTCRALIDQGAIGRPLSAVGFMGCAGHESWHPSPAFYYDIGGGPMLDMGPYYITALVNLLGPIVRVGGTVGKAYEERTITSRPLYGTKVPVKTPTHLAGNLDFENGVIATLIMSFDIRFHHLPQIEIYGTEGTLLVPDPNGTGGQVLLRRAEHREWRDIGLTHTANAGRGAGVADMAYAIRTGRPVRASGELAHHVLDAMQAFEESSNSGCHITLRSRADRPAALPSGLPVGELDGAE